ncbi:MAG: glutamate--tRNA ligase [Acidobacteria bacterium]|nr:glutamate--tRNA ligase [Acidobacteriota bacterium]
MSNEPPVRTRFAPSPTGHLHVGGARTAIFNWLFARHHGGTFIVRVEDTDQARSTRESERMVLDDLRWLGLHWDEGPDNGGPHGPYRQSERSSLYSSVVDQLLALGHAYPCFCSEDVLEAKRREAEADGRPPHYDLTCRGLTPAEIDARVRSGATSAIRFHVPKAGGSAVAGDVTIADLIRGEVTWKADSLGDFIVRRSDGMPTYNFCVVVDDHDMQISHVIRAEEHLTNTHRQVLLYRALGWETPKFAHVSLILGQDRSKLSKRHGATSVAAWAVDGYLADAMLNYLTLLGWSPADGIELFDRESAVRAFSLERVNSAPAVFDPQKLAWVNGQYIHKLTAAELWELTKPRFATAGWLREDSPEARAWFESAIALSQKGTSTLADFIPALAPMFEFAVDDVLADQEADSILREEGTESFVAQIVDELKANGTPRDGDEYKAFVERLKSLSGRKGKPLFMPIRVAMTGRAHGPELVALVPLLEAGSGLRGLAPIASPLSRAEALLDGLRARGGR